MSQSALATSPLKSGAWRELVKPYASPEMRASLWQIANSILPFLLGYYLMYRSLSVSYWLTLALALPTGGFMIRTFIIMHDCGHGSFFKNPKWNHFVGTITGILTCTPYFQWTHEHAIHHATSGDLARRGVGDVQTLTVKEYLALSKWQRFGYRLYRNPLVTFGIGPHYIFLWCARFFGKTSGRRERQGVLLTNAVLFTIWGLAIWAIGLKSCLMLFIPVQLITGATGVWLFYVQHQYEDTYWQRKPEWDYATAALMGSSYYKLPRLLNWFSGNIGYHHIHHLAPKIPNYKLRACHDATPLFQTAPTLTFWNSLRCANLKLWDEAQQRMITFGELKRREPVKLATTEETPSVA